MRDCCEHRLWISRCNHEAVAGCEIAVADVDVRLSDPLKHLGGCTRLIADRDHDDVLLLDLAKPGVRQALTRFSKCRGQHVNHATHFTVPVDVDTRSADATDGLCK